MTTEFFQLLDKQIGTERQIKQEWEIAALNTNILVTSDLRYFAKLVPISKYSRKNKVQLLAALQPTFDQKLAAKQEETRLESEQKQSDEDVKVEDKKTARKPLYIAPKVKSEVKAIRVGTKQEKIANLLINGATTQDLAKATGWAIASVKSALHDDMHSRKGYGVKQDGDKYYLVFPEGLNELVLKSV